MLLYKLYYYYGEAEVHFRVDINKFKPENAKVLLDFFAWDYDEDGDPIEELMKRYSLKVFQVSCAENYNLEGVKSWFEQAEGFMKIDGSHGVEITYLSTLEFGEWGLEIELEKI